MIETDTPVRPALAQRILRFPLTLLVLGVLAIAGGTALVQAVVAPLHLHGDDPFRVPVVAASVAALVIVYLLYKRWIERRPVDELALPGAGRELGTGLALGFALFSTVIGIVALGGGYRITGWHTARVLVPILCVTMISGVVEELVFRGLFFRLLEQWLGSLWALALTAALFGAIHLGNHNATWFSGVAIAFEAGISLAALYMLTRRLWAAIGVHAGWNFTQTGVYGVAVSGGAYPGIAIPRIQGPEWLTGGAFGAEASVPALVVMTLFGLGVLWLAWRRGRFVAPRWRAQPTGLQA